MCGGMDYPPGYRKSGSFEDITISLLRSTANILNLLIPGKRRASILLVANERTRAALPDCVKLVPVATLVESGVDLRLFGGSVTPESNMRDEASIIYVGRLVDVKRVDLLIDACLSLRNVEKLNLHIVGDGPLRPQLQAQAALLGDRVVFHGQMPQVDIAALLARATALVLPSMKECGGNVVLEAMANNCPVIAAAWGGPLDYLTDDSGTLVPPSTPAQFVEELANAILRIIRSPELARRQAEAAKKRVKQQFDWQQKIAQILIIYETAIVQSSRVESSPPLRPI